MNRLIKIVLFSLLIWFSDASAQPEMATVAVDTVAQLAPDSRSVVLGRLAEGSAVQVLDRTSYGEFVKLKLQKSDGTYIVGFVSRKHISFDEAFKRRWSLGFGFGGSSTEGETSVSVTGEVRYLWHPSFESLASLGLSFGDNFGVGLGLAQRGYLPLGRALGMFRPFAQVGFRSFDITDWNYAAWEFGAGTQVLYGSSSFFEVGVFYLWRKAFDENSANTWVFGGSSGIRF